MVANCPGRPSGQLSAAAEGAAAGQRGALRGYSLAVRTSHADTPPTKTLKRRETPGGLFWEDVRIANR